MRVGGQRHAPTALPSLKRPGTHLYEARWAPGPVGTGLEKKKSLGTTGDQTRTVELVACRYTDYAAHLPNFS